MGGTSANTVTDVYADSIGGVGGEQEKTILLENLPEHEHDLRDDANDQYYAYLENPPSATPTDTVKASVASEPTDTDQAWKLSTSGGILLDEAESIGNPINIMPPTLTLNYIIYSGRTT
jgi:microcystin-dependent protein